MIKRVNWKNVLLFMIMVICIVFAMKDLFVLFVYTLNGRTIGFTYFGMISFGSMVILASVIYEYFEEM